MKCNREKVDNRLDGKVICIPSAYDKRTEWVAGSEDGDFRAEGISAVILNPNNSIDVTRFRSMIRSFLSSTIRSGDQRDLASKSDQTDSLFSVHWRPFHRVLSYSRWPSVLSSFTFGSDSISVPFVRLRVHIREPFALLLIFCLRAYKSSL